MSWRRKREILVPRTLTKSKNPQTLDFKNPNMKLLKEETKSHSKFENL